ADVNLVIVGPPVTGSYWEERIKPYLGDKIKYTGHIPYRELCNYYQKARAILVTIKWEEPFGLVMIESMACGTPVIAFRRGSVPEVIEDKKTGFIVENIKEMAEAIKKIDSIKRKDCRKHVENNFGMDRMVDHYEKEFLRIVE
ncbi:MAG: glycosyltransferase, partial [Parcubacteria group bacterium]